LVNWKKYAEKNMSIQGVFCSAFFSEKYACVQANDAQVQATSAVHPGVDAVNCTVLLNGVSHTRAYCTLHTIILQAALQSYACSLHTP
jgi:hypothetical protein